LAIELFSKFGFDHRTAKPEIFSHWTLKTVHFRPSGGFARRFCWRGCHVVVGPHVSPSLSSFFTSLLSSHSLLSPPPARSNHSRPTLGSTAYNLRVAFELKLAGPQGSATREGVRRTSSKLRKEGRCDNPPRKVPYYRLRPIHFGH
jgi:hypothetical protein